ncbi:MAG: CPBP family intramembrane metalloprotease [Eubacterium sp.]|nr:CPBP family intramembrane metalloprotease [Eubacterium sp.]
MRENSVELVDIRKKYSWTGFGYFMFMAAAEGSSILLARLIMGHAEQIRGNSWLVYLLGLAPLWVIGFPICYLVIRNVPVQKPEEHEVKPKFIFQFYLMAAFFMMAGNITGSILTFVINKTTGIVIPNTTIEMVQKQELLPSLAFTVLIAPFFEELTFRKLLIDRLGQYSKKYTIILSGLMFGLFHTNLHQFFYATLLGMLFAYIYTISGKLRYTVILHMTVNFIHGIIPMIIVKNLNLEELQAVSGLDPMDPEAQQMIFKLYTNPAFLLFLIYMGLFFIAIVAGVILFALHHSQMKVDDRESPLDKKTAFPTIYINIGMILYIIGTLGVTIYEIIRG